MDVNRLLERRLANLLDAAKATVSPTQTSPIRSNRRSSRFSQWTRRHGGSSGQYRRDWARGSDRWLQFRSARLAPFSRKASDATVQRSATVVLVARGAGRAVAFALMDLGVAILIIHGPRRTAMRSTPILRAIMAHSAAESRANLSGISHTGRRDTDWQYGFPGNPSTSFCAGLGPPSSIYTPMETKFILADARRGGPASLNGGGMCVHQAVRNKAFLPVWTRHNTPSIARSRPPHLQRGTNRSSKPTLKRVCRRPRIIKRGRNFRFWHENRVKLRPLFGRLLGGKQDIIGSVMSISAHDPSAADIAGKIGLHEFKGLGGSARA